MAWEKLQMDSDSTAKKWQMWTDPSALAYRVRCLELAIDERKVSVIAPATTIIEAAEAYWNWINQTGATETKS